MYQQYLHYPDRSARSVHRQAAARSQIQRQMALLAALQPDHTCISNSKAMHYAAAKCAPAGVCKRQLLCESALLLITPAALYPATAQAAQVATALYIDPDGRFKVLVPRGWKQVNLLPGTGILASWYDPDNRGSDVVAVYAAAANVASTQELGPAKDVGEALASISPGGQLQQWGSRVARGKEYITTQVLFTGISAGSFGAVVDFRCSVIAGGQQYTLRVASKAANLDSNPGWYKTVNRMVESFQVLV